MVIEPHERLEQKFGEWCGNPNTVACASGSAALHLALETLELPRNSQVLIPDYCMIACARACTLARHRPVFVDCDERLLLDVAKIPTRTNAAAIMPVHVYGRRCDMSAIVEFANLRGMMIVEDMAEAHGIEVRPETDAACWSFYRNKIVAGEEGGMIAFRNPEHATKARSLRSCGLTKAHDFSHIPYGMNYRMSNLHARMILPSLAAVKNNLAKRKRIEAWYDELIPVEWRMPPRDVCWVYDLRIPGMTGSHQNLLIRSLNDRSIPARHAFKPMSGQAEYLQARQGSVAQRFSREVIYLPVDPREARKTIAKRVAALLDLAPVAPRPPKAGPSLHLPGGGGAGAQ